MGTGSTQFLAFTFGRDARLEGQLVGALERIEIGGAMRILDGVFVAREAASGELTAISLSDGSRAAMTSRLIDFRLNDRERRTATQQALDGASGEAVQSVGAVLAPGTAIAAVLVEHRRGDPAANAADALADALARVGGTQVASEFVEASGITELAPRLVATAESAAG
jgi:hypothetical protein